MKRWSDDRPRQRDTHLAPRLRFHVARIARPVACLPARARAAGILGHDSCDGRGCPVPGSFRVVGSGATVALQPRHAPCSTTREPRTHGDERIVGLDERVPLLDGRLAPYINLDNAASTPALGAVLDAVQRFLPYYSGVHRGTGFKSRLSTAAYDEAHAAIARFVGADPADCDRHLREEHH